MKNYLFNKNKIAFSCYVVFQLLHIAAGAFAALLLNWIVDQISLSLQDGSEARLLNDFLMCTAYAAVLGVLTLASQRMKARCVRNACLQLKNDVMAGILFQNPRSFSQKGSSSCLALMNQNMDVVEEQYFKNTLAIYESIAGIVLAAALLVMLNPIVAAVSLVLMSIPGFIPRLFGARLASLQERRAARGSGYNGMLQDVIRGFFVIKDYQMEGRMRGKFGTAAAAYEDSKEHCASALALVQALSASSGVFAQFLVICFAGLLAVRGYLTLGSIIAVTQLTGQAISPAFQLSTKLAQLKSVKGILSEMEGIARPAQESDLSASRMAEGFSDSVELRNLSLVFDDGTAGLEHINLRLKKGLHYAVIGSSGSGKSTLLGVLAAHCLPTGGDVLVDGVAGRCVACASVRQEVFLFSGTLRDNITLFTSQPEDKLTEAVEKSGLRRLVERLPEGLDTRLEENASRLSGGERQRIALARAMIHGRQLLLLDEATSALDARNARLVEETVRQLQDSTVVAVTHRTDAETLAYYDEVILLDNGRIVSRTSPALIDEAAFNGRIPLQKQHPEHRTERDDDDGMQLGPEEYDEAGFKEGDRRPAEKVLQAGQRKAP